MSAPSCKECRFWWKRPESAPFDLCRRFPKYEPKSDADWCGEFQAAGNEGPAAQNAREDPPCDLSKLTPEQRAAITNYRHEHAQTRESERVKQLTEELQNAFYQNRNLEAVNETLRRELERGTKTS